MLKYKLICSDLDDTLITSDGRLTDEVRRAVERYKKAGGRFCIVTGRMTVGAVPICKQLGLDTETATYQGAIITDLSSNRVVFEECLDTEAAAKISDYITEIGAYCQTYFGDYFYTQRGTEYSDLYGKICGAEYIETGVPLGEFIRKEGLRPPKVLILEDPKKVPALKSDLTKKFGDSFRINTSKPFIIEIISKYVSKARAVEFIAGRHGIKREEIACIGDSENDAPMLEYAGLGVAVSNASDSVKAIVKKVVPSNDENGVAHLIDAILAL